MEFPVDLLTTLSHEDLEHSAEDYMSDLLYSDPNDPQYFTLPNRRKIPLSLSSVGYVPLYGADLKHKVLALFAPEDQFTAAALYLAEQWWAVEDILKTSVPSRKGLVKVRSLGERIVLYVLNRIVYRAREMTTSQVPFLCHSQTDFAKILWKDGEAVGFYSVKPEGSLCSSFLTLCYQLPVLDSIFLRKQHRGKGHGIQILEDFVNCFTEDTLGLRYPLSPAMYKVCAQYLDKYPGDQDLLWEVEGIGVLFQRVRLSSRIQALALKETHQAVREESLPQAVSESEPVESEELMETEAQQNSDEAGMETEAQQNSDEAGMETEAQQNSDEAGMETEAQQNSDEVEPAKDEEQMNSTEIVLEHSANTPVSTRTRSSHYRRKRLREEEEEEEEEEEAKISAPQPTPPDRTISSEPVEAAAETPVEEEPDEEAEEPQTHQPEAEPEETLEEAKGEEEEQEELEAELLKKPDVEPVNGEVTDELTQTSSGAEEAVDKEHSDTALIVQSDSVEQEAGVTEAADEPAQEDTRDEGEVDEVDVESPEETHEQEAASPEGDTENGGPVGDKEAAPESPDDTTAEPCEEIVHDRAVNSKQPEETTEEATETAGIAETEVAEEKPEESYNDNEAEQELQTPMDLSQDTLLLVELKDVSFQPQMEEQKDQVKEPDEEPEEQPEQDSTPASKEKAVESNSDEAESEPPVVDRRVLRRKAKASRGPTKKRSKTST
ncbi:soluble lamin-associated protein of 75 kDa isoform X2 [Acipenser ruthenus]|uniref:soluble lamin-associated protein of 75 kDa isoform X2 n=1 Tax=Acipenser ruthenus TaxID=7906 RepID=UPI001560BE24|nr:soluble lamin-associated protein of 75 kDa isoform X2 [Acipenser ruthenus]